MDFEIKNGAIKAVELIESLREEKNNLLSKTNDLQNMLDLSRQSVDKLEKEVADSNQEIGMLKNRVADLNNEATRDKGIIDTHEREIEKLKDDNRKTTKELEEFKEQYRLFYERENEYKSKIAKQEQIVASADVKVKELTRANVTLEDEKLHLEKIAAEYNILKSNFAEISTDNEKLSSENEQLKNEVLNLRYISGDIAQKNKEIVEKSNDVRKAKDVVSYLQSKLMSLEKQLKEKDIAKENIEQMQRDIERLSLKADSDKQLLEEKNEIISQYADTLEEKDKAIAELIADKEELRDMTDRLNDAMLEGSEKIDEYKEKLDQNLQKVRNLEEAYEKKSRDFQTLKDGIAGREKTILALKSSVETKLRELGKAEKDKTELKEQISRLSVIIAEKDEEVDSKIQQIDKLTGNINDLNDKIAFLHDQSKIEKEKTEKIKNDFELASRLITKKDGAIYELKEKLESEQTESRKKISDLEKEIRVLLDNHESDFGVDYKSLMSVQKMFEIFKDTEKAEYKQNVAGILDRVNEFLEEASAYNTSIVEELEITERKNIISEIKSGIDFMSRALKTAERMMISDSSQTYAQSDTLDTEVYRYLGKLNRIETILLRDEVTCIIDEIQTVLNRDDLMRIEEEDETAERQITDELIRRLRFNDKVDKLVLKSDIENLKQKQLGREREKEMLLEKISTFINIMESKH